MIFLEEDKNKDLQSEVVEEQIQPTEDSKTDEKTTVDEEVKKPEVKEVVDKTEENKDGSPKNYFKVEEDKLPSNFNPFEVRTQNPKFKKRVFESIWEERIVQVKRVIKVTKGGRQFKFSALVTVGDKNGRVGFATAKSVEVPDAIKKAVRLAKKNLYFIKIVGEQATIPHEVVGHHGASKVLLKPAGAGRGIIASNNVRSVVELAGIKNIYSKRIGSNNPENIIRATIEGLAQLRTKQEIFISRGLAKPEEKIEKKPNEKQIKEKKSFSDKKPNQKGDK